jgi:hypothetical protein
MHWHELLFRAWIWTPLGLLLAGTVTDLRAGRPARHHLFSMAVLSESNAARPGPAAAAAGAVHVSGDWSVSVPRPVVLLPLNLKLERSRLGRPSSALCKSRHPNGHFVLPFFLARPTNKAKGVHRVFSQLFSF